MNTSRQQMTRGIVVMVACVATIVAAQDYQLSWWTVDGGGAESMTGGSYTLSGTTGQPDASAQALTGGSYTLVGGFWPGIPPACTSFAPVDFDRDCDVDAADYAVFGACFSGPMVAHNGTPSCRTADLDVDGDVDESDFGVFQRCYSGAGKPAAPGCAG